MRMAPCPNCGAGSCNNFKEKNHRWYSKCFQCGFTSNVGMPTRKLARYNWNLLAENMTGNTYPDDACGRQERAFMKKEKACGLPELVQCLTIDDYNEWTKTHDISKVDWVKQGGKHCKRGKRVQFTNHSKKEVNNE